MKKASDRLVWLMSTMSPAVQVKVCISYQTTGGSVLAGVLQVSIWLCSPWFQYSPVPAVSSSPLLSARLMAVTWQYGFFVVVILNQSVQFPPPPSGEGVHVKRLSPARVDFWVTFPIAHFSISCRSLIWWWVFRNPVLLWHFTVWCRCKQKRLQTG